MIIGGFDTETTGFVEPDHRIIEACVIRYDYDPMTMVATKLDSERWRYNPERDIPAKARAVHGIHESDLVGEPTFKVAGSLLATRLATCDVVVAHNGNGFDCPFLIQELERCGLAIPDFIPFDTMLEGRWSTPFGKAPNLQELCFACGVEYNSAEAHAAEYDVNVMMDCFFFGLRHGSFSLST